MGCEDEPGQNEKVCQVHIPLAKNNGDAYM